MKLDISVSEGWTRLEYHSFDAYNEATKLQEMIELFHKREGHYPSRVLADKIYRNQVAILVVVLRAVEAIESGLSVINMDMLQ